MSSVESSLRLRLEESSPKSVSGTQITEDQWYPAVESAIGNNVMPLCHRPHFPNFAALDAILTNQIGIVACATGRAVFAKA